MAGKFKLKCTNLGVNGMNLRFYPDSAQAADVSYQFTGRKY